MSDTSSQNPTARGLSDRQYSNFHTYPSLGLVASRNPQSKADFQLGKSGTSACKAGSFLTRWLYMEVTCDFHLQIYSGTEARLEAIWLLSQRQSME